MELSCFIGPAPSSATFCVGQRFRDGVMATGTTTVASGGPFVFITTMTPLRRRIFRCTSEVSCAALSPCNATFAAGDVLGCIYIGRVDAPCSDLASANGHVTRITALAWTPDGKHLLSVAGRHDGVLCMWSLCSGHPRLVASGATAQPIYAIAVAGGVAVTAGARHLKWWNLSVTGSVDSNASSGLAPLVALRCERQHAALPASAAAVLKSFPAILTVCGPAFTTFIAVAGCEGDKVVALSSAGAICIFDDSRRLLRWVIPVGPRVTAFDVLAYNPSHSSESIVVVSWDGICILDVSTLTVTYQFSTSSPRDVPDDVHARIDARASAVTIRAHRIDKCSHRIVALHGDGSIVTWQYWERSPAPIGTYGSDDASTLELGKCALQSATPRTEPMAKVILVDSDMVGRSKRCSTRVVSLVFVHLQQNCNDVSRRGLGRLFAATEDGNARLWATHAPHTSSATAHRCRVTGLSRTSMTENCPTLVWTNEGTAHADVTSLVQGRPCGDSRALPSTRSSACSGTSGGVSAMKNNKSSLQRPMSRQSRSIAVQAADGSVELVVPCRCGIARMYSCSDRIPASTLCRITLQPPISSQQADVYTLSLAERDRFSRCFVPVSTARSPSSRAAVQRPPHIILSVSVDTGDMLFYSCCSDHGPQWSGFHYAGQLPNPTSGLNKALLSDDQQTLIVAADDGTVAVWRVVIVAKMSATPAISPGSQCSYHEREPRVLPIQANAAHSAPCVKFHALHTTQCTTPVVDLVNEPSGRYAIGVCKVSLGGGVASIARLAEQLSRIRHLLHGFHTNHLTEQRHLHMVDAIWAPFAFNAQQRTCTKRAIVPMCVTTHSQCGMHQYACDCAYLLFHCWIPSCTAVDAAGMLMAIGYVDGSVRILDYFTGNVVAETADLIGSVSTLCFSQDCRTLAAGGNYGSIALWHLPAALTRLSQLRLTELQLPQHTTDDAHLAFRESGGDANLAQADVRTPIVEATMTVDAVGHEPCTSTLYCVLPMAAAVTNKDCYLSVESSSSTTASAYAVQCEDRRARVGHMDTVATIDSPRVTNTYSDIDSEDVALIKLCDTIVAQMIRRHRVALEPLHSIFEAALDRVVTSCSAALAEGEIATQCADAQAVDARKSGHVALLHRPDAEDAITCVATSSLRRSECTLSRLGARTEVSHCDSRSTSLGDLSSNLSDYAKSRRASLGVLSDDSNVFFEWLEPRDRPTWDWQTACQAPRSVASPCEHAPEAPPAATQGSTNNLVCIAGKHIDAPDTIIPTGTVMGHILAATDTFNCSPGSHGQPPFKARMPATAPMGESPHVFAAETYCFPGTNAAGSSGALDRLLQAAGPSEDAVSESGDVTDTSNTSPGTPPLIASWRQHRGAWQMTPTESFAVTSPLIATFKRSSVPIHEPGPHITTTCRLHRRERAVSMRCERTTERIRNDTPLSHDRSAHCSPTTSLPRQLSCTWCGIEVGVRGLENGALNRAIPSRTTSTQPLRPNSHAGSEAMSATLASLTWGTAPYM